MILGGISRDKKKMSSTHWNRRIQVVSMRMNIEVLKKGDMTYGT